MKRIKLPKNHNYTTRCFPRSMREAFPNDASYSDFIEHPSEEISRHDLCMVAISLMLWVCLGYLFAN